MDESNDLQKSLQETEHKANAKSRKTYEQIMEEPAPFADIGMTEKDWASPDWSKRVCDNLMLMEDEDWHGLADSLLCGVLLKLGYKNIVKAYNDIPKWYE